MPAGAIPFPFGDCRVCLDKATGVHYGVATCEGCKGFFKRSIPKADKYKCFYQGQCTLSPQERNRCKLCRFRRCLEVGMSVDGVKMGRIPKLEKERALAKSRQELEAYSADGKPVEGKQSETAGCSPLSFNCFEEQFSNERPSPMFYNWPRLEKMSHDQGIGTRCSSSDSGIDDDVRDVHEKKKKEKTLTRSFTDRSDVYVFEESISGASAGVSGCDVKDDTDGVQRALVKVARKSEMAEVELFPTASLINSSQFCSNASSISAFNESPALNCRFLSSDIRHGAHSAPTSSQLRTEQSPVFEVDQMSASLSVCGSDSAAVAGKILSSPTSSSSLTSSKLHSGLPFYPTVIKELLNQVIETGHADELRHNLVRKFLSESETTDWRNETWIECLNKSWSGGALARTQLPGSFLLRTFDKNSARNLKRTVDVDAGESDAYWSNIKRMSLGCKDESFVAEKTMDSREGHYRGISKVTVESQSEKFETLVLTQKNKNRDEDTMTRRSQELPESMRMGEDTKEPEISEACLEEINLYLLSKVGDFDKQVDVENKILGASCPERLQRMKKIEDIVSRVPELTFWNIPECTLSAESLTSAPPIIEVEQCKREIQEVLDWLKLVGHHFTEKSRLDFSIWEKEVAGLRQIHPLNSLTHLTQKDIGMYWEEVVACVPLCNFLILGLCSSIPGFNQLDKEDRAVLMEEAYFDLWMILLSSVFRDGDCFLRLVCEARFSRFWMQVFMPEKLVNGMFHFAEELNSCNLTPCEHVILCAIQLTSKEHEKLKNLKKVQQLHDYYLDLLAYQIEQTHKSNHSRVLIKIFQLLPMLTPISHEQLELSSMLRVDQPPDLTDIMLSQNGTNRE